MTNNKQTTILIILWLCILPVLSGSLTQCTDEEEAYTYYCSQIIESEEGNSAWHLAIYLDTNACLTCCEDMASWKMLEEEIPKCGGRFSIWAPKLDSIDVAEVMRLEGIKTPVHVLDQETVKFLQSRKMAPPIKVLFDSACQPVIIQQALKAPQARELDRALLDTICSPEL